MQELPYAHGGPPLRGTLRESAEDFLVDENLGFAPSGQGEHVFLRVRKRGANTDWVAGRLAAFAGVQRGAVSYAGLKDRHAVTTQTFSVQLPGKADPDWSAFAEDGVSVLDARRHDRKLRRGALESNAFAITIRQLAGDRQEAERRINAIVAEGVPNYFGEQRFGREGQNAARAVAFFQGKRVSRKQQGMLISAARSQIFNAVLAERVAHEDWNRVIPGEACCLAGSRSWFIAEELGEELSARVARFDIHPSGPLWGSAALPSQGLAASRETSVAKAYPELVEGLEKQRLDHDRRPLRLLPKGLSWEWLDPRVLRLTFQLPAGSYATTVLRELITWSDASQPD